MNFGPSSDLLWVFKWFMMEKDLSASELPVGRANTLQIKLRMGSTAYVFWRKNPQKSRALLDQYLPILGSFTRFFNSICHSAATCVSSYSNLLAIFFICCCPKSSICSRSVLDQKTKTNFRPKMGPLDLFWPF